MLESGTRLGRFHVISPLGAGGMGEVYRARDTRLGREVAVKLLPDRVAADPDKRARLEREARALASLSHPGIATLHEVVDCQGHLALVMELVDGEDLARKIERGPLLLSDALNLAGQMAAALDHAHQRGILHRDLKPSNVAVTPDGRAKLLDFGLAKAIGPADDLSTAETATTPAPTEAGTLLGTVPYMSPEQVRGEDVDRRTDVWAFGCVLYELLSGRRAFPGSTRADTIAAVLSKEPAWELLPGETTAGIRKLLRRCLQKDRAERLRDLGDAALEIKDALLENGAARVPTMQSLHPPPARWRTRTLWVTGLLVLAAVGVVTWRATRQRPVPEEIGGRAAPARPAGVTRSEAEPVSIEHEPIGCAIAGQFLLVEARLEPADVVASARVYFRSALGSEYYWVDMSRVGRTFVGKLPKPQPAASPITYYIVAYAGATDARVENGRTREATAVVVPAPRARSASDPAAKAACPEGAHIAAFGPPGAVTVYAAGGADLVFSLKDAFGLEDLVAALEDPDTRVREEAANSLGAIGPGTTRAIAEAVASLGNRDPEVREKAAADLAETGRRVTRQVMTALVEALEDPEESVRAAASRALGEIGPGVASAVVALRRLLKDADPEVRKSATEALGSIGTALSPAIAALEREASGGQSASQTTAKQALAKIRAALAAPASPAVPPS